MTRNIGPANGNWSGGFSSTYCNPDSAMVNAVASREARGQIGDRFLATGGKGMSEQELTVACEEMDRRKKDDMIPSRRRLRAMIKQNRIGV